MDKVRALLSVELRLDSKVLAAQLTSIEVLAAQLCLDYRKAEAELTDYRGKLYNPSLKTELERRVDLDRNTRAQQQQVDELKDLTTLVQQRLELGQVLLETMNK